MEVNMVKGYCFIVLAAVFWAITGIFSEWASREGVKSVEIAFWRAIFAWFCFLPLAVVKNETRFHTKDVPLLLVFSLLGISLFYFSYFSAVDKCGAGMASVLLYTAPVWVVLFSRIVFKESLTFKNSIAILLVILGVVLISLSGNKIGGKPNIEVIGLVMGVTAGFCYSLYYTLGKHFSENYSAANLFLIVLPFGAVGLLPFVEFSPNKSATAWFALICVAVVSTFIANYLYYVGLKFLEAGRASIIATLEPVFAAIAAYLLLGETFSALGYCGASLVGLAVLITVFSRKEISSKDSESIGTT